MNCGRLGGNGTDLAMVNGGKRFHSSLVRSLAAVTLNLVGRRRCVGFTEEPFEAARGTSNRRPIRMDGISLRRTAS
jgi:hypothetical protein